MLKRRKNECDTNEKRALLTNRLISLSKKLPGSPKKKLQNQVFQNDTWQMNAAMKQQLENQQSKEKKSTFAKFCEYSYYGLTILVLSWGFAK